MMSGIDCSVKKNICVLLLVCLPKNFNAEIQQQFCILSTDAQECNAMSIETRVYQTTQEMYLILSRCQYNNHYTLAMAQDSLMTRKKCCQKLLYAADPNNRLGSVFVDMSYQTLQQDSHLL